MSAYHSMHLTGGSQRVFGQVSGLQAGSVKAALSHPAHQWVTQAVGRLLSALLLVIWCCLPMSQPECILACAIASIMIMLCQQQRPACAAVGSYEHKPMHC